MPRSAFIRENPQAGHLPGGVERATLDEALFTRHIPSYPPGMLDQDLAAMKTLFPE